MATSHKLFLLVKIVIPRCSLNFKQWNFCRQTSVHFQAQRTAVFWTHTHCKPWYVYISHVYLGLWLYITFYNFACLRSKGQSWLSANPPHADKHQHVPLWYIHKRIKYVVILSHVCHILIMIYCVWVFRCRGLQIFIKSQHFLSHTLHTSARLSRTTGAHRPRLNAHMCSRFQCGRFVFVP